MTALCGWLATYLLHSTVLLAAAWLIDQLTDRRRPQLAETVWRCAVLGALLTTTAQVVVSRTTPAKIAMPTAASPAVMATRPIHISARSAEASPAPPPGSAALSWLGSHAATAAPGLAAVWLLGALLASIRLVAAATALRRLLRARTPRPPGRMVQRLARTLGVRRPVAVSTSRVIPVPFTTGIRRPEVCCPERLMAELAPRLQAGILAHELAHVARRDVAWRRVGRGLAALLWLQPLNLVARRRLEALGETLCDRRAAACTGQPRDLAACLVEVAAWVGDRPQPLAAMAPGRELDRRVADLLEAPMSEPRSSSFIAVTAGLGILVAGALLPAVSWTAVASPPLPPEPAAESPPSSPAPAEEPALAPAPSAPATAASTATSDVPSAPSPAEAPAPPVAPSPGLEDAIVEALMTKAIVDPDVDQAEIRRVVEEVLARENHRRQRDIERRLREMQRREARDAGAAHSTDDRAADIERRVQEMVERDMAARRATTETRAAEIERRTQEMVERDMKERQVEATQLAAELATRNQARDSTTLEAQAAALEAQARALAAQQDQLREEAARLAEEAARLREEQQQPDPE